MGGDARRPPPPPGPSGRILCGRPAYVTFQRTRRLPVAGHPARQNLIVPEDVLLVVLSDTIARPAVGTPACPLTVRAVLRRIFALEAALSPDRLLAECGDPAGKWGAPHRRSWDGARASPYSRTGVRKRRGWSFHTLAFR